MRGRRQGFAGWAAKVALGLSYPLRRALLPSAARSPVPSALHIVDGHSPSSSRMKNSKLVGGSKTI